MTLRRHAITNLSSSDHAPTMHRICQRIAARRQSEADTLPAPDDWQPVKPSKSSRLLRGIKHLRALFLLRMTGIRSPELGEAYRYETSNHLDPL